MEGWGGLAALVSGGQTGVDRAALDVAMERGIPRGGWCPAGRWAEDGPIDGCYPLRETPSADPAQRTEWNARDSDGTALLVAAGDSPGTALTRESARRLGRPVYPWQLDAPPDAGHFRRWLQIHRVRTLNVAGPRESEAPGIYAAAADWLRAALP
ncbi:putative molybdenum carrier protein [Longimicrobium sp.]|uniref:putative molybdenum carrier protein n=1 Tax=Longimicrobium sp. TaxID=2029185 RepID=UPI002E32055B|nr:putative molybdenum carrier protein [Longimicrobium sp.]HEX6038759.1 putative molybdenum carrier protein [Longimicrobium sp.]